MKTITSVLAVVLLACMDSTMAAPQGCSNDWVGDWICGGRWNTDYEYDPVIISGSRSTVEQVEEDNFYSSGGRKSNVKFELDPKVKACNGNLECIFKAIKQE